MAVVTLMFADEQATITKAEDILYVYIRGGPLRPLHRDPQ
jgi:hypothetical protein